ncbi:beta-lactamase/transpeptidase-like protein [Calocera viscosa TUFC12733]|uniref:Beta-lactamase/transpeptidase-like protein n=1 Tax=Calocera viscosa (strain TUFC12733) TaxID=1330018 RepID=A0A167SCF5_CALVF|nr:beta-lactamase/transpeptidase-like protein [Calocera viscosa TUFC12733]
MRSLAVLLSLSLACAAARAWDSGSGSQLPLSSESARGENPNVTTYLSTLANRFHLPGISVAIVRLGEEAELLNWGVSSEAGAPSTADTLYSIASNSKAFAAAGLGLVIDDYATGRNVTPLPSGLEKLEWTTRVKDVLPEWALMDEYASEHAQLVDLLSHVTGMPRHDLAYSPGMDISALVHSLRHLRPTFELREQWQYNNMMYGTTSYLISQLSAQPYIDFVSSRIFAPLGMNSSTYRPQEALDTGRLADNWVYAAGPGRNETRRVAYFLSDWSDRGVGVNAGAGGVITSTRDLVQFVGALLNGGKYPGTGEQVLPTSVIDRAMSSRSAVESKPAFPELSSKVYGAGWWRYSYAGHQLVQHSGNVPGFTSRITLLPDDKLGIISLTNGDVKDPAIESLHFRIIEDEFGLEHVDWPTRLENFKHESKAFKPTEEPSAHAMLPLTTYVGTYAAPGYFENFTLCAWSFSTDAECGAVFDAYAATYPSFETDRTNTLYAQWPTLWSTHFRLVPNPAYPNLFNAYIDTLYPHGAGEDKSPFYFRWDVDKSRAEFLIVDGEVEGVGMWGLEAGPRERVPGKPRESSEAFFDKLA